MALIRRMGVIVRILGCSVTKVFRESFLAMMYYGSITVFYMFIIVVIIFINDTFYFCATIISFLRGNISLH